MQSPTTLQKEPSTRSIEDIKLRTKQSLELDQNRQSVDFVEESLKN